MQLIKYAILACCLVIPSYGQEYEGEAQGKNGLIRVSVSVVGGKISDINVLESKEDKTYVYGRMKKAIIDNNNINVDIISGASFTSRGFLKAIELALAPTGINFKGRKIKAAAQ